jgi:subtilisin-like proprotein convertase family protein
MRNVAMALSSCLLALACVGGAGKEAEGPALTIQDFDASKSDEAGGEAILPAEELASVERNLRNAITAVEREIARLESEIAKLETDNRTKAAEIDSLVRQIESRRSELEAEYNRKRDAALIFAIFGYFDASAISLVAMMNDDSRLRQLNGDLSRAQSQQADIRSRQASYQRQRDALRAQLSTLRTRRDELLAILASPPPTAVPDALRDHPELARLAHRVRTLESVLDNGNEQVAVLTAIRDLALGLSDAMDATLATLRSFADAADRAVRESRAEFHELLELLASGDPSAAAQRWLEDQVAARTRELLSALDWPAELLVEHLLATRAGGELDVDALREDLLDAILDGAGTTTDPSTQRYVANANAAIPDLGEVSSAIEVEGGGAIRSAAVELEIEHSFIGDLVVSVVHDGIEQVVHQRTGGARDEIRARVVLDRFAGAEASGEWQLIARDRAAADAGTLVRWTLELVTDEGEGSIEPEPEPEGRVFERTTRVAIPDNFASGATDAISVPPHVSARTVAVSVQITHSFIGDLVVVLRAPDGTQYTIHDRAGGATDNLDATVTVQAPSSTEGAWALVVSDRAASDVGALESWSLTFAP